MLEIHCWDYPKDKKLAGMAKAKAVSLHATNATMVNNSVNSELSCDTTM